MTGLGKFLVGAAGASLLAWGAHAMSGEAYVSVLEEQGRGSLVSAGIEGVTLAMARDPLSRVAVLDGVDDPAARAAAEAAALATPGISFVRWADDDAARGGGAASEAAVAACQSDVDALLADKVITFRSGSAYMPDSSLAIVDEVAGALAECDGMAITVGGHTDATGSVSINQSMSQARADVVAAALTERGIAADRITAKGFGATQLKVAGDGANAANRRIEFTLTTAAPVSGDTASEGEGE